MSLIQLLKPVVPNLPTLRPEHETEILREIPTETLYLALKEADTEAAMWFFENALPAQVQGIIDLDCWMGAQFLPDRFENVFQAIVMVEPLKMRQYMHGLDLEVLIRGLLENVDVVDYIREEPLDLEESQYILSPDYKYALIFKQPKPMMRELLFLWLNKFSAVDLDHMRKVLEACKWEVPSDLEEESYRRKRARLEEMGFVDRLEALELYSRGEAAVFKRKLLAERLPKGVKANEGIPKTHFAVGEDDDSLEFRTEFLPAVFQENVDEKGLLAEALAVLPEKRLREIVLAELLRVMNMALAADDLIQASLGRIEDECRRARRYIELGLLYCVENSDAAGVARAAEFLETSRLKDLYHLGWLIGQDLVRAASVLKSLFPPPFFGEKWDSLVLGLKGRHPDFQEEDSLLTVKKGFQISRDLLALKSIGDFFRQKLEKTLELAIDPLKGETDSVFVRLFTALFRQACAAPFSPQPIRAGEWKSLIVHFDEIRFHKSLELVIQEASPESREILNAEMDERLGELGQFIRSHQTLEDVPRPDPNLFHTLRLA